MNSILGHSLDVADNQQAARTALIEEYEPKSDVFFSSRSCTLLAKPPFANLLVENTHSIAEQARQSLRFAKELGIVSPVVIGAINFDADKSSHLRVSSTVDKRKGHEHIDTLDESDLNPIHTDQPSLNAEPSAQQFAYNVKQALEKFAKGELDKVVLSRTIKVQYSTPPNVHQLLKNLAVKNHHGYLFAVDLKPLNGHNKHAADFTEALKLKSKVHALVGASPELLIAKKGNQLIAHPLAGSEPRTHIQAVDQESEARLLASEKDHYEHALVVKAIKAALTPFCKSLKIPDKPSVVTTPSMMHLGSLISGELHDETTTSLELALALHPTPAVCGYPTHSAKKAIKDLESHRRNVYAGMVGWSDEHGDGEWAVSIRCAEVEDTSITVYAGAGIVNGSCPVKETKETEAKFNTMLNAMGVAQR